MNLRGIGKTRVPSFDRDFFGSEHVFSRIGEGEPGGKASGLLLAQGVVERLRCSGDLSEFEISIPRSVVITTEIYDLFMARNHLHDLAGSDLPDHRIAHEFQKADLPVEIVGDLHALIEHVHRPLAVRSSSLMEDALFRPFAGVYATKMTPNNQPDTTTRFLKLVEAIKLVYASTFFSGAREYLRAARKTIADEKMAVIIQEVVGNRFAERFYPEVSGVARSHNFYPLSDAQATDGVVHLALGLGKTIVDGEVCWTYVPSRPEAPPPFASVGDTLRRTQLRFWAIHMGRPPEFDPTAETEYLLQCELSEADYDGSLDWIASTYDPRSERIFAGTSREGPRVLTFAPLLAAEQHQFNAVIRRLLSSCHEALETPVEIEFALRLPCPGGPEVPQIGFLQMRPMVVSDEPVSIEESEFADPCLFVGSCHVMGNGMHEDIRDIVYVAPDSFSSRNSRSIAGELGRINRRLVEEERPYVLIGFGRWGSVDPALGIPVEWGQISGAKVIIEATLPEMNVEPSQGSHFFHNITSFKVSYFHVHHEDSPGIHWPWIEEHEALDHTEHVRLVRLDAPLLVKVDGTTGRGGIWHRRGGR